MNRAPIKNLHAFILILLIGFPISAGAQEWLRSQDSHAWARFQPESWKTVRVTHSLIDEAEKVTSQVLTTTTTKLLDSSHNQYVLGVESTVIIGEQKVNQSKDRIKRNINFKGDGFSDVVENAPQTWAKSAPQT